jgi:hypothetical protein
MRLVLTLFVIGFMLVLIIEALVSLLESMLALLSMCRAWLECLVAAIRRNFVILFLLMLVIVITMTTVIAILPLVFVTIILVASRAVATVTPMTLFCDTAGFLIILLPELMAHLGPHAILDLMLAFLHKGAICHLQVENVLKVLCDRVNHLVTKALPLST